MTARSLHRLLFLLLAAVAALLASGCETTPVKPWERGVLAGYSMRADRDPLATAMNDHIYFSRESTAGGRGVGGSGCGCN